MWIKPINDPKAKWKRITYHDWLSTPIANRSFYEVKNEPLPTQAQKLAMLKGRIIRHTLATQAQAAIATNLMDELVKLTWSTQNEELRRARSNISLSKDFAASAIDHLQIAGVYKKKSPSNLS